MAGWIKWFRSAELNQVLNDGEPFDRMHAFLWMVESAAPKATTRKGVKLKRGQLWTTYRFMMDTWHWGSHHKVKRFLTELEADKMIKLLSHKNGTLITIEKYTSYQGEAHTVDTQTATQTATINKKNIRTSTSALPLGSVPSALAEDNDPRYKQLKVVDADVL